MGRKRIELGPTTDAEIAQRMKRGQSCQTIAKAIGGGVSYRTISRRMQELRGKEPAKAPVAPAPEAVAAGEVPDVIPEGVDLGAVDKWISRVERAAAVAEADGDFTAMSSLMAKFVALLEHKRKATPLPKPDPNENPDFVAAAKRAREMLHKLIVSST